MYAIRYYQHEPNRKDVEFIQNGRFRTLRAARERLKQFEPATQTPMRKFRYTTDKNSLRIYINNGCTYRYDIIKIKQTNENEITEELHTEA